MHFAFRCPDRIGGVVFVGDIPNYLNSGVFTGWFHRIYNLEWARHWTNGCESCCLVVDWLLIGRC